MFINPVWFFEAINQNKFRHAEIRCEANDIYRKIRNIKIPKAD